MSDPRNKAISILLLLTAVVLVVLAIVAWSPSEKEYSAVYLQTGDVYFGKLSFFPTVRLSDPWYFQHGTDPQNQSQVQFVPLRRVIWAPESVLYLNPKEIVFWTKLQPNSDLVRYFKAVDGGGTVATAVQPATSVPTTTPVGLGTPEQPLQDHLLR